MKYKTLGLIVWRVSGWGWEEDSSEEGKIVVKENERNAK